MFFLYNGNPVAFIDPSGLKDIALRSTIEALGGIVSWNEKTGIATVYLDGQKVQVYAGDKNGSYIKNGRLHTDDGWLFKAMAGMVFELGKGWTGRIERHGSGDGYQRHVVLINRYGNEHAQNEDGSPHDKGGSPPGSIKRSLINKKGWDWDAKEKDWLNKIEVNQGMDGDGWIINYPNGREVRVLTPLFMGVPMHVAYPNSNALKNYYTGPTTINPRNGSPNDGSIPILPMPNPVPLPVPGPVFVPLPI